MQYRYRICPQKAAAALLTSAMALVLLATMLYLHEWLGSLLCLLIALVFGGIAALYGATVTLTAQGVTRRLGRWELGAVRWEELREVGVVGTKVFNRSDPKKYGRRFIYFSPERLDEDRRFRLALEWPPGRMLYLEYDKARLEAVQMFWNSDIAEYNCGDIFF